MARRQRQAPMAVPHPFNRGSVDLGPAPSRTNHQRGQWADSPGLPRGVEAMGYTREGIAIYDGIPPSIYDAPAKRLVLTVEARAGIDAPKLTFVQRVRYRIIRFLLSFGERLTRRQELLPAEVVDGIRPAAPASPELK